MDKFKVWFAANQERIAWAVVVAAIVVAGFLGVTYPIPAAPTGDGFGVLSTNQKITSNRDGSTLNVLSGGQINAQAGSTVVFSGDFQPTVVRINSTPVVPFSTPRPTTTPRATATPNISGGLYTVCNSQTITGTGTINHTLATPSYVIYGMAEDATGDHTRLSHTNASATVTIKVWNSALTPAASTAGVTVNWCATGTK